jgi:hypothetical protein
MEAQLFAIFVVATVLAAYGTKPIETAKCTTIALGAKATADGSTLV